MKSNATTGVLIVEDNRDLADLYAAWLSDSYAVKTAYDGEDALDRLDTDVDIVLLDRRMPTLSGDEVLGTIWERGFDCQVALVTSVELDFDSLALGFDDYLRKPVTKSSLNVLVESLSIRTDYSAKVREYFSLLSKRVALQSGTDADEFAERPEVRELNDFSEDDYRAVFRAFSADGDSDATFSGHS